MSLLLRQKNDPNYQKEKEFEIQAQLSEIKMREVIKDHKLAREKDPTKGNVVSLEDLGV